MLYLSHVTLNVRVGLSEVESVLHAILVMIHSRGLAVLVKKTIREKTLRKIISTCLFNKTESNAF